MAPDPLNKCLDEIIVNYLWDDVSGVAEASDEFMQAFLLHLHNMKKVIFLDGANTCALEVCLE